MRFTYPILLVLLGGLIACETPSIQADCAEKNLPRCETQKAIACGYSPGIAGYSVHEQVGSCGAGATCGLRETRDGTETFNQAYCLVSPEAACDPATTASTCVDATTVRYCDKAIGKVVSYACGTKGTWLPPGCTEGSDGARSCTAEFPDAGAPDGDVPDGS